MAVIQAREVNVTGRRQTFVEFLFHQTSVDILTQPPPGDLRGPLWDLALDHRDPHEVASRNRDDLPEIPAEAYGYVYFDRYAFLVTDEGHRIEYVEPVRGTRSGIYFLGGTIMYRARIDAATSRDSRDDTLLRMQAHDLLRQMTDNGLGHIVLTARGSVFKPFREGRDTLVL